MEGFSINRRFSLSIAAVLTLGRFEIASADKLSDFQQAVNNKGCESIPYDDLKSTCQSQQAPVHEWCDGSRGPVSCGSEGITRQLKDAIEKAKREIDAAKDAKDKADQKRSQSI